MSKGSDLDYCIRKLLEDEANLASKKELKNFVAENLEKLMESNTVHVAIIAIKNKGKKDENGKKKIEKKVRVYYPHKNGQYHLTKKNLGIATMIKYLNGKNFFLLRPM